MAHLRLTQRLRALGEAEHDARVILTDTLESPLDPPDPDLQFGDAQVLATEQTRSVQVKLDQRVTVVIGNPPYRRVAREAEGRGSGGWVLDGRVPGRANVDQSLFDDVLDVARANTGFLPPCQPLQSLCLLLGVGRSGRLLRRMATDREWSHLSPGRAG